MSGGRSKVAAVAFAEDVLCNLFKSAPGGEQKLKLTYEITVTPVRVGIEESLQEVVHVPRHLLLIGVIAALISVRETDASGLVNVDDVSLAVPRVRVKGGLQVAVDMARTILEQQGKLAAAARAASHPKDL